MNLYNYISDSAQALLDVAAHYQHIPVLHYAMLHRIHFFLKFLVEEYNVHINRFREHNTTHNYSLCHRGMSAIYYGERTAQN